MKLTWTVRGDKEVAAALKELRRQIPDETRVALEDGLQPITDALKTYPSAQSHRNPKVGYNRGVGTIYYPTNHQYHNSQNYREQVVQRVTFDGSGMVGYIHQGASYSSYLRGDLDGNGPAYMHQGIWEPVQAIVDRLLPGIVSRIETQLFRLIAKLGLGGK